MDGDLKRFECEGDISQAHRGPSSEDVEP